jgi:uncharacterized membrane protein
VRWAAGPRDARGMTARNSAVAPYLWTLCLTSLAPALFFWNDSALLAASMVAFVVLYVLLYWSIVRFRTPSLMKWPRAWVHKLVHFASKGADDSKPR